MLNHSMYQSFQHEKSSTDRRRKYKRFRSCRDPIPAYLLVWLHRFSERSVVLRLRPPRGAFLLRSLACDKDLDLLGYRVRRAERNQPGFSTSSRLSSKRRLGDMSHRPRHAGCKNFRVRSYSTPPYAVALWCFERTSNKKIDLEHPVDTRLVLECRIALEK